METLQQPNVMDQFNAIVARTQMQNAEPSQIDTTIKHDFKDPKTGETKLIAYSTTGETKTQEQFAQAYKLYEKRGNRIDGFTFLEPGTVKQIARSAFESVNQPVQKGARAISNLADASGINAALNPFAGALDTAKKVPEVAASTVNTPEKAGALAGTVAGAAATGGTSLIPQILAIAGGASLGHLAGDLATGSTEGRPQQRVSQTLQAAGMAAVSQGALGAFKQVIGRGLSQKAQEQVAGDLMDLLKREAGSFTNDPAALAAFTSTRPGANKLINVGIKGLRGDAETIAKSLHTDLRKQLPVPMSKETATALKDYSSNFAKKSEQLLDNIDDVKMVGKLQEELYDIRESVVALVKKEAKTNPYTSTYSAKFGGDQADKASNILTEAAYNIERFKATAEVLHYMKQSVGPQGFDPSLFQKLVQFKSGQVPGSVLDQAGNTAFRGATDRLVGTDTAVRAQIPYGKAVQQIPLLNRIPGVGGLNVGADIGKRYVGNVRGQYPVTEAVAAQQTLRAIDDYLSKKKR